MNMIEAYEAEIPRGIDLFFGQTQFYPNIEKYLKKQYAVSKKFTQGYVFGKQGGICLHSVRFRTRIV
jgi:hypothetical protein